MLQASNIQENTTDIQAKIDAFSGELKGAFEQVSAKEGSLTAQDIQKIRPLIDKISPSTFDTEDNLISFDKDKKIIPHWKDLVLLLINYSELNHQHENLKIYNELFEKILVKHNFFEHGSAICEPHKYLLCHIFLDFFNKENRYQPQSGLGCLGDDALERLALFYIGLYKVFENDNKVTEDSAQLFFQEALLFLSENLNKANQLPLEASKAFKHLKKASEENNPIALFYCGFVEIHGSVLYKSAAKEQEMLKKGFTKIIAAKKQEYMLNMVSLKKMTPIADLVDTDTDIDIEEFLKKYDTMNSDKVLKRFLMISTSSILIWYYKGLYQEQKENKDTITERSAECFYHSANELMSRLTPENLKKLDDTGLETEFTLRYLTEEALKNNNPFASFYKGFVNVSLARKNLEPELKKKIFARGRIGIAFAIQSYIPQYYIFTKTFIWHDLKEILTNQKSLTEVPKQHEKTVETLASNEAQNPFKPLVFSSPNQSTTPSTVEQKTLKRKEDVQDAIGMPSDKRGRRKPI